MAKPTTTTFSKFVVSLGDGASPEVFAAPCGFTNKGFTLDAATSTATLPDCDDPEAASWEDTGVTSLSATITGSGVMALESYDTWRTAFLSGQSVNARVQINEPAASHGGYYQGAFVITSLGHTAALGSDANRVQLSVNMKSDGALTWTPAAS